MCIILTAYSPHVTYVKRTRHSGIGVNYSRIITASRLVRLCNQETFSFQLSYSLSSISITRTLSRIRVPDAVKSLIFHDACAICITLHAFGRKKTWNNYSCRSSLRKCWANEGARRMEHFFVHKFLFPSSFFFFSRFLYIKYIKYMNRSLKISSREIIFMHIESIRNN